MENIKRVAIIKRSNSSDWKSCQFIMSNLEKALSLALKKIDANSIKTFEVVADFNQFLAYRLCIELHDFRPDLIIWLDHIPCASFLIAELPKHFEENLIPRMMVFIYGDFILDSPRWNTIQESISKIPIQFITASTGQEKLVRKVLGIEGNQITTIPFSVDEQIYNLNNYEDDRSEIRKKLSIEDSSLVLVYTGRISYQKNIDLLLKSFNAISKILDDEIYLLIAGQWDDILLPYFGKHGKTGSYFQQIMNLTESNYKNVKWVGSLNSKELNKVLNASDLFISLSTYNDEDFGMSPAEASMTGIPLLLSGWGGYRNFNQTSNNFLLVDVEMKEERASINGSQVRTSLLKSINGLPISLETRLKNVGKAKKYLSIESVGNRILERLDESFFMKSEYDFKLVNKVANCFINNPNSPFKDWNLYQEVYGNYVE